MLSSLITGLKAPSTRSLEFLAGSDLLSSTALITNPISILGPIASAVEETSDDGRNAGGGRADDGSGPSGALDGALAEHVRAALALTGSGDPAAPAPAVDPGHPGAEAASIVTAVTAVTALTAQGGVPAVLDALPAAAAILAAAQEPAAPTGLLAPVAEAANQTVLEFHADLEEIGHRNPIVNDPIHALTALGETAGLGYLGTPGGLVTDVANLPGAAILGGEGLGAVAPVLHDLGTAATAAGTLITSVAAVPASGGGLLAPGGGLGAVASLANEAVSDLGALGSAAGLGQLGTQGTLITDAANLPGALLTGAGLGAAAPVLADLGTVAAATGSLVDGLVGHLAGPAVPGGANLLGPGGALQPAAGIANTLIDGVHAGLEQLGHEVPLLNDPLHAVVNLGTTAGPGALGETHNLVTDVVNLPGDVLAGQAGPAVSQVGADLGHVAAAAGTLVGALGGALDGAAAPGGPAGTPLGPVLAPVGDLLGGPAVPGGASLLGPGGALQPAAGIANTLIDGVHAGLEQLGHEVPLLNDPLHAVVNLGTTAGPGALGETHNLVTDIVNLPGDALAGQAGPAVSQVGADLGQVGTAAGGVVASLGGTAAGLLAPEGGSSLGGALAPVAGLLDGAGGAGDLHLLGGSAPLQPVANVVNPVVDGLAATLGQASHGVPVLGAVVPAATDVVATAGPGALGETHNLVTDAVNLPGDVLAGQAAPAVSQVAADLGHVAQAAGGIVAAAAGDAGPGPLAPVAGVVEAVAGGAQGALAGAVPGGGAHPLGDFAQGVLDGLSGSGAAGGHPLVEATAGPPTAAPLANVHVLAPEAEPVHAVQVDAVGVGASQPSLAILHVLGGDSIEIPPLSGGGADSLVGSLHDVAPAALPAQAGADAAPGLHIDLGAAALDLGGHVEAQAHDPSHHAASPTLHLLGL
ncbi:hypothetical protein OPKNFCMD_6570 [Methylobacterium crusticola]|uniref:PE-PGRS family protein n=1 Tax=Methylobacterium crusticola TaxID=1697972 RepID=A0ABQ4R8R2_9HYPH|nr:hypothetical protein [Methylobacterium crusticola]GJD53792.1 hypothetical protein OPKNFCMD_6570 [Methylobacterium crusticola]